MALTIPQLAYAIRFSGDDTTALAAPDTARITRVKGVADAYIMRYASTAPEAIKDEAVILFTGYIIDGPDVDVGGAAVAYPSAWRNCGAEALLSPWRLQRAGVLATGGASAALGGGAGGLDEAALVALIDRRIAAAGAQSPSPSGGAGLTVLERQALNGAVQYDGLTLSGRDLDVADSQGSSKRLAIPGISIRDESTLLGDANGMTQISFVGDQVEATAVGDEATVTFTGLTTAQVLALIQSHPAVQGLGGFEAAMRRSVPLAIQVSVTIGVSNAAGQILIQNPRIPSAAFDGELVFRVGTGLHQRFPVADLLAKPAVSDSAQLSSTNALQWTEGDNTYSIARAGGVGAAFYFSCDNIGTYLLDITSSTIDLAAWARASSSAVIPSNRLPAPPARAPWAIPGATARIPDGRLSAKAGDVLGAFSDAGWAEEGDNGLADVLIGSNVFTRAAVPTLAEASGAYERRRRNAGVGPILNAWWTMSVPATIPDTDVAKGWLRVRVPSGDPEAPGEAHTSDTWTLLGSYTSPGGQARLPAGGYKLYAVKFVGVPNSDYVTADRYSPFRLNTVDVEVPGIPPAPDFAGRYLKSLSGGASQWDVLTYDDIGGDAPLPPGLTDLNNGPITGLTVTATNTDHTTQLDGFSPAFDLDDYEAGELHISVTFSLSGSNARASFRNGSVVRSHTATGLIFLSELKASTAWAVGGNIEGVAVGEAIDLYDRTSKVGSVLLYLARDSNNLVGTVVHYDGLIVTTGFTIAATARISFAQSDAPATSGGGMTTGGGFTRLGAWTKAPPTGSSNKEFVTAANARLPTGWKLALVCVSAAQSTGLRLTLGTFMLSPGPTNDRAKAQWFPSVSIGPYSASVAGGYPLLFELEYQDFPTVSQARWSFHGRVFGAGGGRTVVATGWTVQIEVWYL